MNKTLLKEARRIVKQYDAKIVINRFIPCGGAYDRFDNIIYINPSKFDDNLKYNDFYSRRSLFGLLFHELGHKFCTDNKIWKHYHYTEKEVCNIKKFKATAFKAEKWVDRWATREIQKYYPQYSQLGFYYQEPSVAKKFLYEFYGWD